MYTTSKIFYFILKLYSHNHSKNIEFSMGQALEQNTKIPVLTN